MGFEELARLFALFALGFPAILFFRRLHKTNAAAAWRYLLGIAGMFVWAVAGVVVMASALPDRPDKVVAAAAILFLLGWIALAITAFLTWGVPPHIVSPHVRARLRTAMLSIVVATCLCGLALVALT